MVDLLNPGLIDLDEGNKVASLKKPAKEKAKTKRAENGVTYHKSFTWMITKPRYVRFKHMLAKHDRLGQELITELVDKWMDAQDAKERKEQEKQV